MTSAVKASTNKTAATAVVLKEPLERRHRSLPTAMRSDASRVAEAAAAAANSATITSNMAAITSNMAAGETAAAERFLLVSETLRAHFHALFGSRVADYVLVASDGHRIFSVRLIVLLVLSLLVHLSVVRC